MPGRSGEPILEVWDLKKHFPVAGGLFGRRRESVRSVDGVSFALGRGETLGLVGESGCGKSTLGRLLVRLLEPTSGRIVFNGVDVSSLSLSAFRKYRQKIQIIFQDPFSSLNKRMTVGDIVAEPLENFFPSMTRAERAREVGSLLERVGLSAESVKRFPHEFSGGQRQRIGIARALAARPELIVADEPVSALDVSVQAQVVNLMKALQKEYGFSYLFIAHDLAVVNFISDRVGVMYLGKLVELADRQALFSDPRHPYTRALLAAIPVAAPTLRSKKVLLTGELPSPRHPPAGCHFRTRCPLAFERCLAEAPAIVDVGDGRQVACHLVAQPG